MTIKITYGTVTAAADDIRQTGSQIEGELDRLNGRVLKVVGTWDGEAQGAFYKKHQGWEHHVTGLHQTLKQIGNALDNAASGYQRTDRKAAQQFDF
jgi:6 kDa early secretory antigenic target